MLTLYYKPTCSFCMQVLGEAEALHIKLDLKNIAADPVYREELIAKGGKAQTPFLIDSERGVQLFDSNDIIAYMTEQYGGTQTTHFGGLRVHKSEETCDTCQ